MHPPAPRPSASRAKTTTYPATSARVTSIGWEKTEPPRLVAWVKFTRDDESWALRFEVLSTLETISLDGATGGPAVQLSARGAVERYLEEHRTEVEKLLHQPPR
jgi:hypothetical protein